MMGRDAFFDGYAAGAEGRDDCPHWPLTPAWCLWHAGHHAGHQMMCAQLEFIMLNFPQD